MKRMKRWATTLLMTGFLLLAASEKAHMTDEEPLERPRAVLQHPAHGSTP